MPATSASLLVAAIVLSLGGVGAVMARAAWPAGIAFGAALVVVAFSAFRPYFAVAHGPLRRRRAFEPERVREMPTAVVAAAYLCLAVGVVALGATLLTGWIGFLAVGGQAVAMGTNVLWLMAPLGGVLAATVAFGARKDQGLLVGTTLGDLAGALREQVNALYDRLVARPGNQLARGVEDVGLPAAEAGVGRAFTAAGGLAESAERGLPWLPTVLALAVVLAAAFALMGQGLSR